jgi:hypothetical protein
MFGLPRIRRGAAVLAVLAVLIIPAAETAARDSQKELAERGGRLRLGLDVTVPTFFISLELTRAR